MIVLSGLLPLIPTISKPNVSWVALSTEPMFLEVEILSSLIGLGSSSSIFALLNVRNPML